MLRRLLCEVLIICLIELPFLMHRTWESSVMMEAYELVMAVVIFVLLN